MNHFQRQNTVTVMACIAMAAVAFFFYFEDSSASDKAIPKVLIAFGEARKKDKKPKPEKSVKPELATPESYPEK